MALLSQKRISINMTQQTKIHASQSVKYDLIGKLVAETKLTRKAIVTDSGRH